MKILVIYASAGAGHLKAAEALYNGIKKIGGHEVVLVDVLDQSTQIFKKFYKWIYYILIAKVPWLWGFFFWLTDVSWLQPLIRLARRLYNTINVQKFHKFLKKEQFDYIFSTHFMPTEISAAVKRSGQITSKLFTIITDFDVHKIWLAQGVETYIVASNRTMEKIRSLGIDQSRVVATGIPTDEKFSMLVDIGALKKKLGLHENVFTILIATGAFGIGPIEEIIKALSEFQVIVVCGHNKDLYRKLSVHKVQLVKVMGLVDNMHELMAVSDAMVTKPGGLSISEALVSQLPLIFFNAIPGQEEGNINVLKTYGIGISDCSISQIREELVKMKYSRDAFLTTLKKTKALARPSAVRDIISLIK